MKTALLDVNVLIALQDPMHLHHEEAHHWFSSNRRHGWATCPLTINGCVRILCSSGYPGANLIPGDIIESLAHFCASHQHEFWNDSVSLLDGSVFKPRMLAGGRAITDAYLLALAVRNGGRLATFDRSIPVKAVAGAGPQHLALIGAGAR